MKIHLVVYSDGEPFNSTKYKTIKTIHHFSKNDIIIHDYTLEKNQNDY